MTLVPGAARPLGGTGVFTQPPQPVAVPAIERELARLWHSAADPGLPGQGQTGAQSADVPDVMRASVSNLIAFSPAPAPKLTETLLQVVARHPCRAILLQVQPDLPADDTRAEVALACRTSGSTKLCCEYIALSACGLDADQLPGATLPLLLTDLPTFLWWLGDPPFGSEEFLRLSQAADCLVVDTARFQNPLSTFTELALEVSRTGQRRAVSDLNWARLTPWRALVASLFDSREWRPCLDHLASVSIDLNNADPATPANPIAAFLVMGWLASRLGWRLDRLPVKVAGNSLAITFHAGRREVTASLNFLAGAPHGRMRSLRIDTGGAVPPATFHITRASDSPHAETRVAVGAAEPIVRVAQYEHRSVAALLAEEMERLGRDPVYEAALAVAESIRAMLQVEIFITT